MADPPTLSGDPDPSDRRVDRLLARLGLLQDASPLVGSGQKVPRAGVLLAVPALVPTGVFTCAQQVYQGLGPAFYGLRTSLLTLLLMALWRIKRPEGLKEHSPEALGQGLGLDRAPEVKTLRRKLAPERKHLTNVLKRVAYQAESALFRAVSPHYRRAQDEGRTLIQSALASAADLDVSHEELRGTVAPLSSPHRTRAFAALCEELNQTHTVFPGSSLRMRFAVQANP